MPSIGTLFSIVQKYSKGRFASGLFWSVAGGVSARLIQFGMTVVLARLLLKEEFGQAAIMLSTMQVVTQLAMFGPGITATKYIAEYRKTDVGRVADVISLTRLVALFTGLLGAVLLFAFAPVVASEVLASPSLAVPLRIVAVVVLATSFDGAYMGALTGFEAFRVVAHLNLVKAILPAVGSILGAIAAGLEGMALGLALGSLIALMLTVRALKRVCSERGVKYDLSYPVGAKKILFRYSLPAFLSGFTVSVATWTANALLVNQPQGYESMAEFNVANSWRVALGFFPALVTSTALPILTNHLSSGVVSSYKRLFYRVIMLLVLSGVAMASLLWLAADLVLSAYGPGYAGIQDVFLLMILAAVFSQIAVVSGLYQQSTGQNWWGWAMNVLWAGMLVGGAIWWAEAGALGLARSYMFAYAVLAALAVVYVAIRIRNMPQGNA